MKRALTISVLLAVAVVGWAAYQAATPAPTPLAKQLPPGALLYLEARDFSALLAEWNASPQKAAWLKTDNYSVFSKSRLFLRLEEAQKQFAAAAGLPPDMKFAGEVAGQQSALAIYDIGKLEFVYVTRMPSAKSMQTAIWQLRTRFEPRSAGGASFFIRTDPESKRVVGFGATDEYLVLGTREDLIAGAMALLSHQSGRALADSEWYVKSVAAGPRQSGDLRMVLNLAEIAQTPQFRTYWIQQNITETRQYFAGIVDLYRTATEYREERVLLRDAEGGEDSASAQGGEEPAHGPVTADGAKAVADLARLVPDGAGLHRVTANPSAKEALRLVLTKILTPHIGPAPVQRLAPQVTLSSGETGSESDLETRIDQEPVSRYTSERSIDELEQVLTQAAPQAVLEVASTQRASNGVFVASRTVLAFAAAADWNGDAVRSAIRTAIRPGLTAGELGVAWRQAGSVFELDGLMPVYLATQGRTLFLSDDRAALDAVLARTSMPTKAKPAAYIAGFDHAAERENFLRLTGTIDRAAPVETVSEARMGNTPDAEN
ncbi:MAG TPA: hypothetical protein VE825_14805, partial [Terriglobales bacterium]|nr:hypothetical protein [Terriglobales bacterium]